MILLDLRAHFASGHALFSGGAFLLLAVLMSIWSANRFARLGLRVLVFLALLLVASSATPLPWAVWIVWAIAFGAWAVIERRQWHALATNSAPPAKPRNWPLLARCTVALVTLLALGIELPYHLEGDFPARVRETFAAPEAADHRWARAVVVGDSISAGIYHPKEGTVWPLAMSEAFGIEVLNLAVAGARVDDCIEQTEFIPADDCLVIVEIGGNDMLGSTTPGEFETHLEALIARIVAPRRAVVMMELPLIPGGNRFGAAQRRVAAKFRVPMIPKSVFAGVLSVRENTLGDLHLSAAGHAAMARAIGTRIAPLIRPKLPHPQTQSR